MYNAFVAWNLWPADGLGLVSAVTWLYSNFACHNRLLGSSRLGLSSWKGWVILPSCDSHYCSGCNSSQILCTPPPSSGFWSLCSPQGGGAAQRSILVMRQGLHGTQCSSGGVGGAGAQCSVGPTWTCVVVVGGTSMQDNWSGGRVCCSGGGRAGRVVQHGGGHSCSVWPRSSWSPLAWPVEHAVPSLLEVRQPCFSLPPCRMLQIGLPWNNWTRADPY